MAIGFRASSRAASATGTIPTGTTTNDVMVAFAFRNGNLTAPSLPTGWTNINTASEGTGGNSVSGRWAWRAWQSGDGNPTFTNASEVIIHSYSGCDTAAAIGAQAIANQSDTTIDFPALTLQKTDNTSWVTGGAYDRRPDVTIPAPTGLTKREGTGTQPGSFSGDTNATVSSWSATTSTVNRAEPWIAASIELLAAAASFVLSAETGVFTETGGAQTGAYKTNAAQGVFTLSGGAAVFAAGFSANTGVFTLTGNAATLLFPQSIVADSGTFSLTGGAATMAAALAGEAGAFTLSGGASLFAEVLTAATGAFTLTGNDATLLDSGASQTMAADTGVFSLTGGAVTLAETLALEAGSFSLAGGAAILDQALAAGAGVFTEAGGAVTSDLRMASAAGNFSLTGGAADLIDSGGAPVSTGACWRPIMRVRRR